MVNATENKSYFSFQPNAGQQQAFKNLCSFVNENNGEDFFILTGAAGTGKTGVVSAITAYLHEKEIACTIAAPTGRAATVVSGKTNRTAKTIHSLIYLPEVNLDAATVIYKRKENISKAYTIFIIDESSMINDATASNGTFATPNSLLYDLIAYVKQGNTANKIIFVGDAYQLAPVGSPQFSPALCKSHLINKYNLTGSVFELTNIERQAPGNYILENAALLRNAVQQGILPPANWLRMQMASVTATLKYYGVQFYPQEMDRIIMITRNNIDAHWWNQKLRQYIMEVTNILQPMDVVLFHRNWFSDELNLYNGSSALVQSIDWTSKQQYADLTFVDVELNVNRSLENPQTVKAKMILEVLLSDTGELPLAAEKKLFTEAMRINKSFRESKNLKDDPYLSAMRLRYGYALTCHKAQDGEWDKVIIHPRKCQEDAKWLYTAVTRARKELISYSTK
jgi:exodeoxyribonuclease-5